MWNLPVTCLIAGYYEPLTAIRGVTVTDILDPANIQAAAAKVDEACIHYEAQRNSLAEASVEVPLLGGYGETGAYMKGLYRFTTVYQEVLGDFLDDEKKFVAFLEGFRDRIQQAAGMYQENEIRSENRFTHISKQLDGDGA